MLKTYSTFCFLWLAVAMMGFTEDGKNQHGTSNTNQTKSACPSDKEQADYQYQVSGMTVSYETETVAKTKEDSLDLEWNLGDNTTIQSKQKFNHTFQNLGNYQTCLTINSVVPKEKPSKKCKVITLGDPYICDADWVPVCGCDNQTYMNSCFAQNYHGVYYWEEGPCSSIDYSLTASFIFKNQDDLAVQFINTSEGNFDTYIWDFGNGQNSNARNPKVSFSISGTYNICLTVSSEVTERVETYCEEVNVAGSY